ncbi:MAG TPA: universal stress protein [Planctomycetota bacterium]|nr:universal stress protein [Planctomycetota bacterium]
MARRNSILVTTDLSAGSLAALPVAVLLARSEQARVELLYVEDPPPIGADTPSDIEGFLKNRTQREREFQQIVMRLKNEDTLEVVPHFKEGPVLETILSVIDAVQPGFVVMATHGRSGISRLLLGSVTEQVLRLSPCPVLCVKQGQQAFGPGPILCCTDLSSHAAEAMPFAAALAHERKAPLHLVMVLEDQLHMSSEGKPLAWMVEEHRRMERHLHRTAAQVKSRHALETTVRLRHGKPAAEICAETAEINAAIIVMASHGRTGMRRLLMGSVTEEVVRRSACPVLVVRSRVQDAVSASPSTQAMTV